MATRGPQTTKPKLSQLFITCVAGNVKGVDWLLSNLDQTTDKYVVIGTRALRPTDDVLSGSRVFVLMDEPPVVEAGSVVYYTNHIEGSKQIDQKMWIHGIAHINAGQLSVLAGKVDLTQKRCVWQKVIPNYEEST